MITRGRDILVRLAARKVSSDDQITDVELVMDEEVGRNINEVLD